MNTLEKLNHVEVTFDDLWHVSGESNELHESAEGGFESLMFLLARLYKGDHLKASAVLFRMQALAHIINEEGAPGWTFPKKPDGSVLTQEWVFAAAAVQPLIEIDNNFRFEQEAFLKKVLELAESEGNA
jgi:hypothetical protein